MDEAPAARTCPQCGQPLAPGVETCAACGRDDANPYISPAAPLSEPKADEFRSHLLIALAAVICVSIAIGVLLPGLGVILALVFVPAAIRAAAVLRRRGATGVEANSAKRMLSAVIASAAVTFLVWLASTIAFTIICFPLGLLSFDINSGGGVGMIFAFGLGGLAGLAVFVWLMRRFWPRPAKDNDGTA